MEDEPVAAKARRATRVSRYHKDAD